MKQENFLDNESMESPLGNYFTALVVLLAIQQYVEKKKKNQAISHNIELFEFLERTSEKLDFYG